MPKLRSSNPFLIRINRVRCVLVSMLDSTDMRPFRSKSLTSSADDFKLEDRGSGNLQISMVVQRKHVEVYHIGILNQHLHF
jgi:hypothetical protein